MVPGRAAGAPWTRVSAGPHPPAPADVERLLGAVDGVERGVVLAGWGTAGDAATAAARFAAAIGWPLLADPLSGARHGDHAVSTYEALLRHERFAAAHRPDVVVRVGAALTSKVAMAWLGQDVPQVVLDPDRRWHDPHRAASDVIDVDAASLLHAVGEKVARRGDAWLTSWRAAETSARAAVDQLLDGWTEPFEGRVARDVFAALPAGANLVVGSSMPVRDLDAYMRPREGLRVLANRGASGIDGFVSTALGVSATGAATTALCGDLTLLHDVGSLIWSAGRGLDCVVVVPNNDGGAIFSFLPQRELAEFEELFATPHGLELGAICRAAGARHALVERAADLIPAIERAHGAGGVHVVEIPIDRARNVELHAAVHEEVASALGGTT